MVKNISKKARFTKEGTVLRTLGNPANPVILSLSCFLGGLTILIGIWIPFAFELVGWQKELSSKDFLAASDLHQVEKPLLLKYPLMRMISRISLGARYHGLRIELAKDLPALLQSVQSQKFNDSETQLLKLFSAGAFQEDSEFVIWLQTALHKSILTSKKILSTTATLAANKKDEERLLNAWQSLISDIRSYLHLDSPPSGSSEPPCLPSACALYVDGPLRGLPVQQEIIEPPESLAELGSFFTMKMSVKERKTVTDAAITTPLISLKERASSLMTTYRLAISSQNKLHSELKSYQTTLEKNQYLMVKKVKDLIKGTSLPPGIFFGDILVPQVS